jgi:hypothetical protein
LADSPASWYFPDLVSTSAAPTASADPFQALDDSKITRFQIKTMFVSGMGFFTDAYDLFVIGIVVSILKTQWSLNTSQVSWLNSSTLLASAFGAILFGRIADMLGRKRIYGYEVLILAAGAIASAFAPGYIFLIVCRVILGIGIGGDYPVSAREGGHPGRVCCLARSASAAPPPPAAPWSWSNCRARTPRSAWPSLTSNRRQPGR